MQLVLYFGSRACENKFLRCNLSNCFLVLISATQADIVMFFTFLSPLSFSSFFPPHFLKEPSQVKSEDIFFFPLKMGKTKAVKMKAQDTQVSIIRHEIVSRKTYRSTGKAITFILYRNCFSTVDCLSSESVKFDDERRHHFN